MQYANGTGFREQESNPPPSRKPEEVPIEKFSNRSQMCYTPEIPIKQFTGSRKGAVPENMPVNMSLPFETRNAMKKNTDEFCKIENLI